MLLLHFAHVFEHLTFAISLCAFQHLDQCHLKGPKYEAVWPCKAARQTNFGSIEFLFW